ncbi:MAG: histidine phosphatase family protein [Actinomycetota bacterium]
MVRTVELRRHTDNDGDVLSEEGIAAAVKIGEALSSRYRLIVSSGAQRATQAAACLLAGMGRRVDGGVRVDPRFRSEVEDRWKDAYRRAGAGDLGSFERVEPELVKNEAQRFASALRDLVADLAEGERALVVGHSPMLEAAIYGLTGQVIEPLSKGSGALVIEEGGSYTVTPLGTELT